ncbi:MAG: DUF2934 domain-containing protein [Gammaproteobacteria bacterium]|nr:MAG: DUF2934 domain-containing protein [Gammaproteobacteria bacterium]
MQINENRIREYAYQIWESEGRPNGRADQHWEQANRSLEAESDSSEGAQQHHNEHQTDNFIPHQNNKKGKHAHHAHQPQPH